MVNGDTSGDQPTPVDIEGLDAGVTAVAAGAFHTCALLDSGAVKCWGWDEFGQLGNGDVSGDQPAPVDVVGLDAGVTAIAAGDWHTCALLASGAVKCWGDDISGQLGNGDTTGDQPTPVDVVGLAAGVVSVVAGEYHTCAVLDSGALECWGDDYNGQLGDGANWQTMPVSVVGLPGVR